MENTYLERFLRKAIHKEETHEEDGQESGEQEEHAESEGGTGTFLEQLSQAGQKERTEGVKSVDRALRFGHGMVNVEACSLHCTTFFWLRTG